MTDHQKEGHKVEISGKLVYQYDRDNETWEWAIVNDDQVYPLEIWLDNLEGKTVRFIVIEDRDA